jgi:hypothetical protein
MINTYDLRQERVALSRHLAQLVTEPWNVSLEQLTASAGDLQPLVYVMGRIVDYETGFYARAVSWAEQSFPSCQVVPARGLWSSTPDWLRRWPSFATTVGLGIIVTGPGNIVGRGVWREVEDLNAWRIPSLWIKVSSSRLTPVPAPVLRQLPGDDWNAWAKVERPLVPAAVVAP